MESSITIYFEEIKRINTDSYLALKQIGISLLLLLNHCFDLIVSFCFQLTKSIILFIRYSWNLYVSIVDVIIKSYILFSDTLVILYKLFVVVKNCLSILFRVIELSRLIILNLFLYLNGNEEEIKKVM